MKMLYLHCGIHKTGSSFLQSLFTRNRELLNSGKIYYPVSHAEYDMVNGNISPGNGIELSESILKKDIHDARMILAGAFRRSANQNCDSVLFSSESLFHNFADEGAIARLERAAEEAGFYQIKALVYFRDPVSHALSTYKHRAKRGDHKNFEEWIMHKYETMELLERFEDYYNDSGIEWSCRKYKKDSVYLAKTSFKDWLGLPVPEVSKGERINPSLSLAEIRILQVIKEIDPDTVPLLSKNFYDLSGEEKKESQYVEEAYYGIASRNLKMYTPLLEAINRHLPPDESLMMIEESSHSNSALNDIIDVNSRQMELVIDAVREKEMSKALVARIIQFWNRGVGKVKRRLKAAGL